MELYQLDFPIQDYCHAVGYEGPLSADLAVITALVRSQLMNIPFENFDVLEGKPVSLEPADIVNKLLYSERGGYCYELNGLFAMLLGHLRVPHSLLLARPKFYPTLRPRTHMVLVAYIGSQLYLIDLGFGSYGPRAPMALNDLDQTITQDNEKFRLSKTETEEFLLQSLVDNEWRPQYSFNLTPQEWIDFLPANYFNSNHADSIFIQKPVVLLHTPQGRVILFGDQLKIIEGDHQSSTTIAEEDLDEVLLDQFGIELS